MTPPSVPVVFTLKHKSLFAEAAKEALTVDLRVEGLLNCPHLRKAIGNAFMSAVMIAMDKSVKSGLTTQIDIDFGDLQNPGLTWLRDKVTRNALQIARDTFKRDPHYKNVRFSQNKALTRIVVGPRTETVQ